MLTKWGFIFVAPGSRPEGDRTVIERPGLTSTIVTVPEQEAAPEVARQLVAEGAQLIELCGIFGPTWAAKVVEAVDGRVPVGSVSYGVESVPGLAEAVAPA
jgi:hypothetical protein